MLITNYYWVEANQQRSYTSQLWNDDQKYWIETLATAASPLSCRPISWWSPQKFRCLIVSKLQNLIMSHNSSMNKQIVLCQTANSLLEFFYCDYLNKTDIAGYNLNSVATSTPKSHILIYKPLGKQIPHDYKGRKLLLNRIFKRAKHNKNLNKSKRP